MQYWRVLVVLAPTALVLSHLVTGGGGAADGAAVLSPPVSLPGQGCNTSTTCGNVTIPYPFGISQECSLPLANNSGDFSITCDYSFNPPKPFLGNMEVTDISLEDGQMVINSLISSICYNSSTNPYSNTWVNTKLVWPYLISHRSNELTGIGCDTAPLLVNREEGSLKYFTGCISYCASVNEAAEDGDDCAGLGCCRTDIVANLSTMRVLWTDSDTDVRPNNAWKYSPCGYAFVAKKGWYNFSRQDLEGNNGFRSRYTNKTIPLVLDWAIRANGSCLNVSGILKAPACVSNNSTCINATNGDGYLCNCTTGYTGNPYVQGGCININECLKDNTCGKDSTCKDTEGGFNCQCNFNRKGDGKSARGCDEYRFPPYAIAAVATMSAVVLACFAIIALQTRKHRMLFNKNGGEILKGVGINIFTKAELKAITKNYSKRVGGGFFGDVYMGTIKDGAHTQDVAVKCTVTKKLARLRQKLLRCEAPQQEQEEAWKDGFVKEITFQFQIRHPNVVRLIGCCLETDVPILVFEYVSNGSLHDKLHVADKQHCYISLLQRLDIALGSAQALSHIHSHGEYNHVHGDIKPANILLDENLKAKVSDFGSSKLLSVNKYVEDVATDGNYADPVYYKTGRFTVKSDVYSFGVVLLELITRKTSRYGENRSLPIDFEKSWKDQDQRWSMYDPDILSDDPILKKCLDMVGTLAVECLNGDADKRPAMEDVVVELRKVKSIAYEGSCLEGPIVDEASKHSGSS